MFVAGYQLRPITRATITYASVMKYSAVLTQGVREKVVQGKILRYSTQCGGTNTTILMVNGPGNRKYLLIGENLLSSCLTPWMTTSCINSCVQFPVPFSRFKKFSAIFFQVLARDSSFVNILSPYPFW